MTFIERRDRLVEKYMKYHPEANRNEVIRICTIRCKQEAMRQMQRAKEKEEKHRREEAEQKRLEQELKELEDKRTATPVTRKDVQEKMSEKWKVPKSDCVPDKVTRYDADQASADNTGSFDIVTDATPPGYMFRLYDMFMRKRTPILNQDQDDYLSRPHYAVECVPNMTNMGDVLETKTVRI